ncbi:SDR family oxidoreductase [Aliiroseovarius sp. F20344]|uniref:SDR family oxidoreductase n=1 Tax=Aliiroseovarius sp. F20344 TaxID=2926414 RepID=UPI001FF62F62|nr:SDR family oxidoreductase [Aliiroseovarius sp. F20344]MCK0142657.1 SDR family oxidoreductase [Aliiroseovarius sp. F20344]
MKRVLVLGGYGLIGSEVVAHLLQQGYHVVGHGRSAASSKRASPKIGWLIRDLADMVDVESWGQVLQEFDVVVNCAGALQDGARDDLKAVHVDAILALGKSAAKYGTMLVQISAAGVSENASTEFFRTKAQGDMALLASGAKVIILRPGLVLSPQSYGGTALIRQLAAFPLVQPIALADTPIQTVSVRDVAIAVERAIAGDLPDHAVLELVEEKPNSLSDVVEAHRKWLGFSKASILISMPNWVLRIAAGVSDALGWLGWRSPLRSTAVEVLKDGVLGDALPYHMLGGKVSNLDETLASFPNGAEHRLKARLSWFVPVGIGVLSAFWLLSGLVGLVSLSGAAEVLTRVGWPAWAAKVSVVFWAIVDLVLGAAVLYRPWVRMALIGMLATSLIYIVSASVVTPSLWLDPLGPLMKLLPICLAISLMFPLLEDR